MDAGVAQDLDEVGVEGVEQGDVEDSGLAVVDHPDIEAGDIIEVWGRLGPHMQEGHTVLVVGV